MYESPQQRAHEISSGATRAGPALRDWVRSSAAKLNEDLSSLPAQALQTRVRTAHGREIAASEINWLRAREVNVHTVDLATGIGFADLPTGFCAALIDDIVGWRSQQPSHPSLTLSDGFRQWRIEGPGRPQQVKLPTPELARWLTGRIPTGDRVQLPTWI
jgi:maleylpyruvate isomerase